MPNPLLITTIIGSLLLFFLCWVDFKRELWRFIKTNPLHFYFLLTVFLLFNLATYLSLCYFFLGESFSLLPKRQGTVPDGRTVVMPLIIAFMYFGTGAAKLSYDGKEIGIYAKLLDLFEHLLSAPTKPDLAAMQASLRSKQSAILFDGAKDLRRLAEHLPEWDPLDQLWKETDAEQLNDELAELLKIQKKLNDRVTAKQVAADVGNDINRLTGILIERIKQYIVSFISENGNTKEDRIKIFEAIQLEQIPSNGNGQKPLLKRPISVSLLCGLALGLIVAITRNGNPFVYMWIGMASLLVFNVVLALTIRQPHFEAVVGGIFAGLVGHTIWQLLTLLEQGTPATVLFRTENFATVIAGGMYGGIIALVLHIFYKHFLTVFARYFKETRYLAYTGYLAIGIFGGLAFFLASTALGLALQRPDALGFRQAALYVSIGFIVAVAAAYTMNIFPENSAKT